MEKPIAGGSSTGRGMGFDDGARLQKRLKI